MSMAMTRMQLFHCTVRDFTFISVLYNISVILYQCNTISMLYYAPEAPRVIQASLYYDMTQILDIIATALLNDPIAL